MQAELFILKVKSNLFECLPPFVLEKDGTSLRKSNSPTTSHASPTHHRAWNWFALPLISGGYLNAVVPSYEWRVIFSVAGRELFMLRFQFHGRGNLYGTCMYMIYFFKWNACSWPW